MNYFDQIIHCPECGKGYARRDWPVVPSTGKPKRTCCLTTGDNNRKKYLERFTNTKNGVRVLCTICKKKKPEVDFSIKKGRVSHQCRECENKYHRDRYREKTKSQRAERERKQRESQNELLICDRCNKAKKKKHWPKEPSSGKLLKFCCFVTKLEESKKLKLDGLKRCSICNEIKRVSEFNAKSGKCKPCQTLYAKKYTSKEKRQKWIDQTDDGTINPQSLKKLFGSFRVCPICNSSMARNDKNLDHIVPLSKGGKHSITNAIILCTSCNSSKGSKNLENWLKILSQSQLDSYELAIKARKELAEIYERVKRWRQGAA